MKKLAPVTFAFILLVISSGAAAAQDIDNETVDQGASLFKGLGLCHACHGPDAKGIPNLGVNLSDDEWLHSDGSLEGILETIKQGVTGDQSSTGTLMPPKGGSSLSEDQLRAVATYVWSLSNAP
jgi:cbb3-type cytochrome c oxidase subunit III